MLTDRSITVTQRGTDAFVSADPKTGRPTVVNIPHVPDNASEALLDAINGFLDHEVAHVLFTDFAEVGKAVRMGGSMASMHNILEDVRIEKCMAERFRGSAFNIGTLGKFFLEKMTAPMLSEAIRSGDANRIIGVLIPPLIRSMGGQRVFEEFMTPDMMKHVAPFYDKIKGLEKEITGLKSTADALRVAGLIDARVRMTGATASRDLRESKYGSSEKDETAAKKLERDKAKGRAEEKRAASKKATAEEKAEELELAKEEDLESVSRDKKAKGEEESERAEEAEAEEGDELEASADEKDEDFGEKGKPKGLSAEEEEEEDKDFEEERRREAAEEADDEAGRDFDDEFDSADFDSAMAGSPDFDEACAKSIGEDAKSTTAKATYKVYSLDFDLVEPLSVPTSFGWEAVAELEDRVNHMVAPMQKDLERIMASRSMKSWSPGHRSGRLHAANLTRVLMGDSRVFRRRHAVESKDTGVSLVVDASGSMCGDKINTATASAFAMSQVLERIGIKHEVIAFTTHDRRRHSALGLGREDYTRTEPLYMPILKGFDERLNSETKRRFAYLPRIGLANNVDGECVEIAARRLLSRKESAKIMIVFSDGNPCADADNATLRKHLKEVVDQVEKSGIRIVGIGIQSTAVESFYKRNVVLNDVKDLPTQVMRELKAALV